MTLWHVMGHHHRAGGGATQQRAMQSTQDQNRLQQVDTGCNCLLKALSGHLFTFRAALGSCFWCCPTAARLTLSLNRKFRCPLLLRIRNDNTHKLELTGSLAGSLRPLPPHPPCPRPSLPIPSPLFPSPLQRRFDSAPLSTRKSLPAPGCPSQPATTGCAQPIPHTAGTIPPQGHCDFKF